MYTCGKDPRSSGESKANCGKMLITHEAPLRSPYQVAVTHVLCAKFNKHRYSNTNMNRNIKVTTCLPNHNIVQRGQPYVHHLSSKLAAADWGERIRLVYHLLRNDVLPVGQTYAEHAVSAKMPAAAADTALRAYTVPAADTSPAFAGAPAAAADMAPASAASAPHHTGPLRPPYTAHDSDSYSATAESAADTAPASVVAPAAVDTASASLAPAADSDTAPASVAPAADADTAPVASVADVIRVPAAARAAADTAPVTGVPAVETVLATAEPPVDDIHPATVVLAV